MQKVGISTFNLENIRKCQQTDKYTIVDKLPSIEINSKKTNNGNCKSDTPSDL